MGILREIWTGEIVKQLNTAISGFAWLEKIKAYDQYVQPGSESDTIHLIDVGVDPDVLVNNTTYPLAVQEITDGDITISLAKFQTKATPISDDSLYAATFDKMAVCIDSHKTAITEKKVAKAAHAIAPDESTLKTPVLSTTGAAENGRKKLVKNDIIALKSAFDKMKASQSDRVLVLSSDHVADLLQEDARFADRYMNFTTGKIANLYGFEIYEYTDTPFYTPATLKKVAFGAEKATDTHCSFAFCSAQIFKATGSTTSYISPAKNDPLNQRNLLNFRHYFVALPKKKQCIGAIVSASAV